jgi:hypothetical protein
MSTDTSITGTARRVARALAASLLASGVLLSAAATRADVVTD